MKRISLLFICLCFRHSVESQSCMLSCNGSFDNQSSTTTTTRVVISCWNTSAADGKFQIWGNGYNGVPSYQGTQFLEMNNIQADTVSQDISAFASKQLSISFAHRGRSGIDSIEVSIGLFSGGTYTTL